MTMLQLRARTHRACPLWVKSCRASRLEARLLYPSKRTRQSPVGAAAKGRFCCRSDLRTFANGDSPHFRKYKASTEKMIASLKLIKKLPSRLARTHGETLWPRQNILCGWWSQQVDATPRIAGNK